MSNDSNASSSAVLGDLRPFDLRRIVTETKLNLPAEFQAPREMLGSKSSHTFRLHKITDIPSPYLAHTNELQFIEKNSPILNNTKRRTNNVAKYSTMVTLGDVQVLSAMTARPRSLRLLSAILLVLLEPDRNVAVDDANEDDETEAMPKDLSVEAFLSQLMGGRNRAPGESSEGASDPMAWIDKINNLACSDYTSIPNYKIIAIKPFVKILLKERLADDNSLNPAEIFCIGKFVSLIVGLFKRVGSGNTAVSGVTMTATGRQEQKESDSNLECRDDEGGNDAGNKDKIDNNNKNKNKSNSDLIDNRESCEQSIFPINSEMLTCVSASATPSILLSFAADLAKIKDKSELYNRIGDFATADDKTEHNLNRSDGISNPLKASDTASSPSHPVISILSISLPSEGQSHFEIALARMQQQATEHVSEKDSCKSRPPKDLKYDFIVMNRGVTEYWKTGHTAPFLKKIDPSFPHSQAKQNLSQEFLKFVVKDGSRLGSDILPLLLTSSTKVLANDLLLRVDKTEKSDLVYAGGLVNILADSEVTRQVVAFVGSKESIIEEGGPLVSSLTNDINEDVQINLNKSQEVPEHIAALEIRVYDPRTSLKSTIDVIEHYLYFNQYLNFYTKSRNIEKNESNFADSVAWWNLNLKHILIIEYVSPKRVTSAISSIRSKSSKTRLRVRICRQAFKRLIEACADSYDEETKDVKEKDKVVEIENIKEVHPSKAHAHISVQPSRFQMKLKQHVVASASNSVQGKHSARPSSAGLFISKSNLSNNSRAATKEASQSAGPSKSVKSMPHTAAGHRIADTQIVDRPSGIIESNQELKESENVVNTYVNVSEDKGVLAEAESSGIAVNVANSSRGNLSVECKLSHENIPVLLDNANAKTVDRSDSIELHNAEDTKICPVGFSDKNEEDGRAGTREVNIGEGKAEVSAPMPVTEEELEVEYNNDFEEVLSAGDAVVETHSEEYQSDLHANSHEEVVPDSILVRGREGASIALEEEEEVIEEEEEIEQYAKDVRPQARPLHRNMNDHMPSTMLSEYLFDGHINGDRYNDRNDEVYDESSDIEDSNTDAKLHHILSHPKSH